MTSVTDTGSLSLSIFISPEVRMHFPLLLLLLTATTPLYAADIYQSVDDKGNPVFSDQPPSNSSPVDLPAVNISDAVESRPPAQSSKLPSPRPGISITHPAPGSVQAMGEPALQIQLQAQGNTDNLMLNISLDGAQIYHGPYSNSLTFDKPFQGEHSLTVNLTDKRGQLIDSASSHFFTQRARATPSSSAP